MQIELQNLASVLTNGLLMSEVTLVKGEMDRGDLPNFNGGLKLHLVLVYVYDYLLMFQNGRANSFEKCVYIIP